MVKRSTGRSATAASAYRAAARIECEREGRTHDYTRKQGVLATGIILPEGNEPVTRAQLWNMAEAKETRKNSQTARDYMFSLPDELSPEGREIAVQKIAAHIVERHGVGVDYAIHAPNREGDQRNHHCHLMMTTRRMVHGKLTEKTRELDDRETGKALVKELRADVADILNHQLAIEQHRDRGGSFATSYAFNLHGGHDTTNRTVHVEHRSFKERGIERDPSQHKGPMVTNIERRNEMAEFRRYAYSERERLREDHSNQISKQKIRHEMEARNHRLKWAQEGKERVERIKANLETAERNDTPLRGLKWLKAFMLGKIARENDARLARGTERHRIANGEIEALRRHYKAQREQMQREQHQEKDKLLVRQDKDRKQLEKSLGHKKRFIDIKRETGRDFAKEQAQRQQRPKGIGRALTPF